jgi:hypothetical protein
MPGHPTFQADLCGWDFSVHPADADFVFHPPAGAEQVTAKAKGAAPAGSRK